MRTTPNRIFNRIRPGLRMSPVLVAGLLFAASSARSQNSSRPVSITVDLREAPRRIFHARLSFPVSPGPLTLLYPKWIPGEHAPTGPLVNLAGVQFTVGGIPLTWRRDDVNMYAIHVTVPAGASSLDVALDYLSPAENGQNTAAPAATSQLAVINWDLVLLYPLGKPARELTYAATLLLPQGWKFGTALPLARQNDARQNETSIEFAPAPLSTLIDSPVIAGAHFRAIPLPLADAPPHEIDLAGDSDAAIAISADLVASYTRLVAEAHALFGAHHYRSYHFLFALSDYLERTGLEHHESSDNRLGERALLTEPERKADADLLTHEFSHSWNGKFRRPAGLATADYEQPMKGDLLWVYEGLSQYLGQVLAARSGLFSPENFRESVAGLAARLDFTPGRTWRPLADTAVEAQILYGAPNDWQSWRRGADYYDESLLIWLEADTIIRRQSQGSRSLDDFCRLFHGTPKGAPVSTNPSAPPEAYPYTFEDIVAAMNQVSPYDWRAFFTTRLNSIGAHAPLEGLEASGWRLVYSAVKNDLRQARRNQRDFLELRYSLGLRINGKTAAITDAVLGSPAERAGISPGMKLIAVNGRQFSPEVILDALRAAQNTATPIELRIDNEGYEKTYTIDYHEGEKYPHLERDPSRPDLLSEIIKPRTPAP